MEDETWSTRLTPCRSSSTK